MKTTKKVTTATKKVTKRTPGFKLLKKSGREWSTSQAKIFENVAVGLGNTVVRARAGTGKTTTILEGLRYVPAGLVTMMVAFNTSIADELRTRVSDANITGVQVSTLHSYGYAAVRNAYGSVRVDKYKAEGFVKARYGSELSTREFRNALCKLVSLGKGALPKGPEDMDDILDRFDIEAIYPETKTREGFIAAALAVMDDCKKNTKTVDFDDMIWLPVVNNLKQQKFDRVFVDEAQDLNPTQIELCLRAVKDQGRICAVGDDRQAIYGFRGAAAGALDLIVDRLEATVLPLTTTYRCGKSIVAEAQRFVPDFGAAPSNPDGVVRSCGTDELVSRAQGGDFVLSRTNAPMVSLCLQFLSQGRRANIQGRDLGKALTGFVKATKIPLYAGDSLVKFEEYLEGWVASETERLAKKNRDAQAVEDKAAVFTAVITWLPRGACLADVVSKIEELFSEETSANTVMFSSTHRAKGLERDRVWMLADTYLQRKAKNAQDATEEENLFYVAVTRAKTELIYVRKGPKAAPMARSECVVCGKDIKFPSVDVGPNDGSAPCHDSCEDAGDPVGQ